MQHVADAILRLDRQQLVGVLLRRTSVAAHVGDLGARAKNVERLGVDVRGPVDQTPGLLARPAWAHARA